MDFILWSALVYGFVQIVTYSQLLDGFRVWSLKKCGYISVGKGYMRPVESKQNLKERFLELARKLINCWLCVSFWTGILLHFYGFSFYTNWLLSGVAAVAVTSFIKLGIERVGNE